jgi:hypothetical protein
MYTSMAFGSKLSAVMIHVLLPKLALPKDCDKSICSTTSTHELLRLQASGPISPLKRPLILPW